MHWHDNVHPWPKEGFDPVVMTWFQKDAPWCLYEDPDIWVVLTDPDYALFQSEIAWGFYETFDQAEALVKRHNIELMCIKLAKSP